MQTTIRPVLSGLFNDRDSAERAYRSISDRGYTHGDVNLVMSDETRKRHFGLRELKEKRTQAAPLPTFRLGCVRSDAQRNTVDCIEAPEIMSRAIDAESLQVVERGE